MSEAPSTNQRYDLEARTLKFAKDVIKLCKSVKQTPINRDLISQVVRASTSVGANYREANDALSKRDFGHRIRIARREAKEAYFWLQLFEEASPDADGQAAPALQEAMELKNILSAIAQKVA